MWILNLPTVAWPQLRSFMESMMHDDMRRMCVGYGPSCCSRSPSWWPRMLLPRSLPPHVSPTLAQAELQVVICTAHGAVVVDEPLGVPQPSKENPSCSWCALAGQAALKLPHWHPLNSAFSIHSEHQRYRLRYCPLDLACNFC